MTLPVLGLLNLVFETASQKSIYDSFVCAINVFDIKKKRNLISLNSVISSGRQKKSGGHDHRTNKGDDRTPIQKRGDKMRRKKSYNLFII